MRQFESVMLTNLPDELLIDENDQTPIDDNNSTGKLLSIYRMPYTM